MIIFALLLAISYAQTGIYNFHPMFSPGYNGRLKKVHACSQLDSLHKCMRQQTHAGATCIWHAATNMCREGSLSNVHNICGSYAAEHLCRGNLQCNWNAGECSARRLQKGRLVIDCAAMQSRLSCTGETTTGGVCMWDASNNACFEGKNSPSDSWHSINAFCKQWGIEAECSNLTECEWNGSCMAQGSAPASSSSESGSTSNESAPSSSESSSSNTPSEGTSTVVDTPSSPIKIDIPSGSPEETQSSSAGTPSAPSSGGTPLAPSSGFQPPLPPQFFRGKCRFNPTKETCVGAYDPEDGKPCFWHVCQQRCFDGEAGDPEDICPMYSNDQDCNANAFCVFIMGCCMKRDGEKMPFGGIPGVIDPYAPPPPMSGSGAPGLPGRRPGPPGPSVVDPTSFGSSGNGFGGFGPSSGSGPGGFGPSSGSGSNFGPSPGSGSNFGPHGMPPPYGFGPGYEAPEYEPPEYEAPEIGDMPPMGGMSGGMPGMPGGGMPGMPPFMPELDLSCEKFTMMSCRGQPKELKGGEICVWLPGKNRMNGKCKSCRQSDPKCMCQRYGSRRQCANDQFCGWSYKDNFCIDKINAAKDNAEIMPPPGPRGPPRGPSRPNPYGPPGVEKRTSSETKAPEVAGAPTKDPTASNSSTAILQGARCVEAKDQISCERVGSCTWSTEQQCTYEPSLKLSVTHLPSSKTSNFNLYLWSAISLLSAVASFGVVVFYNSGKPKIKEHKVALMEEAKSSL